MKFDSSIIGLVHAKILQASFNFAPTPSNPSTPIRSVISKLKRVGGQTCTMPSFFVPLCEEVKRKVISDDH